MSEIKNLLAKMINKINSNEDRIENIEENGSVSSWNDLTDKPFYSEVTETSTNVLEWDGNTDGLVSVEFNSSLIFYKISDVIPKKNDLIGGSVYFRPISNPDMGENSLKITDDLVMTETEDILVLSEGMVVVVKKSGATFQNIQFEEVGVYFIVMTNNDVYSSKLEATSDIFTVTNEVVHKLDPKYLPEGSGSGGGTGNGGVIIDITADEDYNLTSDKTIDEIKSLILNGECTKCKLTFGTQIMMCDLATYEETSATFNTFLPNLIILPDGTMVADEVQIITIFVHYGTKKSLSIGYGFFQMVEM